MAETEHTGAAFIPALKLAVLTVFLLKSLEIGAFYCYL